MKKILKSEKGFALVFTILVLALMSILGIAIMGTTASNYKMAKVDSKSQSSYYIAEAGINDVIDQINTKVDDLNKDIDIKTSIEFFQRIKKDFIEETLAPLLFEENQGKQPGAFVTVNDVSTGTDKDAKKYKVESTGKIGDSTRTVSSEISLTWKSAQTKLGMDSLKDVFVYSPSTQFMGQTINGTGGIIIFGGLNDSNFHGGTNINVKTIYFNDSVILKGGLQGLGDVSNKGEIFVNGDLKLGTWGNLYGNVHVNGDFTPGGVSVHGNVYVKGKVVFGNSRGPINYIEHKGELEDPKGITSGIKNNIIRVATFESFTVPSYKIVLKDDTWYKNKNYTVKYEDVTKEMIPNNAKLVVNNYETKVNQNPTGKVIIISKGDIVIGGSWNNFTGVLLAPNGNVTLGQGNFKGIIITKDSLNVVGGGGTITMENFSDFFTEDDTKDNEMPFEIYDGSGGEVATGGEGTQKVKLDITGSIKEK